MSAQMLTEHEAQALIAEHHIVELVEMHAGMDFRLGDGRLLTFWSGGYEYPDHWELHA